VQVLNPMSGFSAWVSDKTSGNPQRIWPWRPVGFDYRNSTRLGETETLVLEDTNKILHTPRPREKKQWLHRRLNQNYLLFWRVSCGSMGHQVLTTGMGALEAAVQEFPLGVCKILFVSSKTRVSVSPNLVEFLYLIIKYRFSQFYFIPHFFQSLLFSFMILTTVRVFRFSFCFIISFWFWPIWIIFARYFQKTLDSIYTKQNPNPLKSPLHLGFRNLTTVFDPSVSFNSYIQSPIYQVCLWNIPVICSFSFISQPLS